MFLSVTTPEEDGNLLDKNWREYSGQSNAFIPPMSDKNSDFLERNLTNKACKVIFLLAWSRVQQKQQLGRQKRKEIKRIK